MGRRAGKLKVEFIDNQKTRSLVLKRRKDSLEKMIKELSTLCDVKACMVLLDPGHDAAVWPPNDPAQVSGLIQEFTGDDEKAPIGVFLQKKKLIQFGPTIDNSSLYPIGGVHLQKKSELVRAQIDRLKSQRQRELMDGDADHQPQQDQFGPNYQEEEMPRGKEEQAQLVRDQFHHQDQFGHIFDLDDNSSMYQEDSSSNYGNNYHFPQQQYQLFGEGDLMMMMMPNHGNYYPQQQHQYELSGLNLDSSCQEEDYSSTAMMMPDQMMDDTYCGMGFDEQTSRETAQMMDDTYCGMGFDDQTSRETAAADFYDDGGLITQLYTPPRPPMMMWNSFEEKGAADYLQCIDFDDLWV